VQNVKILLKAIQKRNQGAMAQRVAAENGLCGGEKSFLNLWRLGAAWEVANSIIYNTPTL